MKKPFLIAFLTVTSLLGNAQINVVTTDVVNFWAAFDSVQTTTDRAKQVAFVQKLYLNKAAFGLKYTIRFQEAKAENWVDMIQEKRAELLKARPYMLAVVAQKPLLDTKLARFRQLYPNFKSGDVFFVVGTGVFGGRVWGGNLIIGCEKVANENPDWAIDIVLHEFVHTQQTMYEDALLSHSIMEGAADFVAELVNEKDMAVIHPGGYIDFGNRNEKTVWELFKKQMGSSTKNRFYDWLYGTNGVSINGQRMKDLGYFMGYKFCKSYYATAADKQQALREIIEYKLSSNEKAKEFLLKSGYVPQEDWAFVQNLIFDRLVQNRDVPQIIYGFRLTNDNVVMTYTLPDSEDLGAVKSVTVAGSFNNWNPASDRYKMTNTIARTFELTLPKTAFERGKTYPFKFVVNGKNWQPVPENAKNVDDSSTGNLTLQVN